VNVVIFASFYQPHIGGFEKNVHELAKRLVIKGHNVSVITCNTNNTKTYEIIDKVFIIRLPCWNILNGSYPIPLPKASKELQGSTLLVNPDVVITQTRFFPLSFLGMVYALIKRKPLIHVERGSCHSVVSNKFVDIMCKIYDHTFGSLVVKVAKSNVGISTPACEFIQHIGGENPQLIYNGVECSIGKEQLPYSIKAVSIIYVGRLIYAKGVQDLIEAFNKCCESYVGCRLIIVGDGNYREQLESQARKSQYCSQIKFIGELPQQKVMESLAISDIFVNPSYSEGLPTSVLEAASIGLPIVATNVGGTTEIIEHEISGLVVETHDVPALVYQMCKLIKSEELRKKLGNNAKELVKQKFSWDAIVNQWEDLIRNYEVIR
jgi:glycosyltransferase involved in cell wall biosynthesis